MTDSMDMPEVQERPDESREVPETVVLIDRATFEPEAAAERTSGFEQAEALEAALAESMTADRYGPASEADAPQAQAADAHELARDSKVGIPESRDREVDDVAATGDGGQETEAPESQISGAVDKITDLGGAIQGSLNEFQNQNQELAEKSEDLEQSRPSSRGPEIADIAVKITAPAESMGATPPPTGTGDTGVPPSTPKDPEDLMAEILEDVMDVVSEVQDDMEDELNDVLSDLEETNEQKDAVRDYLNDLGDAVNDQGEDDPGESTDSEIGGAQVGVAVSAVPPIEGDVDGNDENEAAVGKADFGEPIAGPAQSYSAVETNQGEVAQDGDWNESSRSAETMVLETDPALEGQAGLRKYLEDSSFQITDLLENDTEGAGRLTLGDLVLSVLPWPFHKDLPEPSGTAEPESYLPWSSTLRADDRPNYVPWTSDDDDSSDDSDDT